jgi:hypothetical protein
MPDHRIQSNKPGLDPNARSILGRQLHSYYESMRHAPVSESLARLLRQFEIGASLDGEHPTGPPTDATAPSDS